MLEREKPCPPQGYFFVLRKKNREAIDFLKPWILPSYLWTKVLHTTSNTATWILGCSPFTEGLMAIQQIMIIQPEEQNITYLGSSGDDDTNLPSDSIKYINYNKTSEMTQEKKSIIEVVKDLRSTKIFLNPEEQLDKIRVDHISGQNWWIIKLKDLGIKGEISYDILRLNSILTAREFVNAKRENCLLCILRPQHPLFSSTSREPQQTVEWMSSPTNRQDVTMTLAHCCRWASEHYNVRASNVRSNLYRM